MKSGLEKERAVRLASLFPAREGRGENGRPLCRLCGKEVPGRRRMWCSEDCVFEAGVIAGGQWAIRGGLLKRDEGRCAWCGFNFEEMEKLMRNHVGVSVEARENLRKLLKEAGFDLGKNLWEGHHVMRVADGGARLGLKNMLTLCQHCHKWIHHLEAFWRRREKIYEEEEPGPDDVVLYLIEGKWKRKIEQGALTF